MTEQKNLPSMKLIAKQLRKYSGRGRMVLIGPVRIWAEPNSGRDSYGVVAATHDKTGRECLFETMVFLGAVAAEPPQWLADAVDGVLLVKQGNEITVSEAEKNARGLDRTVPLPFQARARVPDRAGAGRRDARVFPRREERAAAHSHSRRPKLDMRRGRNE